MKFLTRGHCTVWWERGPRYSGGGSWRNPWPGGGPPHHSRMLCEPHLYRWKGVENIIAIYHIGRFPSKWAKEYDRSIGISIFGIFFFFYICLQITNAKYFIIQYKVWFNSIIISSLLSQTDYQYLYWYAYVNLIKLLIIDPYTCIGDMLFKFSIPFFYPYIIIFYIS